MAQAATVIDLSFPLQGTTIPVDHGYALYAGVARHLPALHGDETIGIHPIRGLLVGGRQLALTPNSRLTLRLPAQKVPDAIRLAGQRLEVADSPLRVGVPTARPLRPAATLLSRLVIIRGFIGADAFIDAVRRQLAALNVVGVASLLPRRRSQSIEGQTGSRDAFIRRTLRIHDKEVVGFAVQVSQLTADESIRLQATGLGGRRRFGCGVFVPAGRPEEAP